MARRLKEFASEAELAAVVVKHLVDEDWEVYEEVGHWGEAYADIVAVRQPLLMVVETKMSLGFGVLGQAVAWKGAANMVVVATPPTRRNPAAERALRLFCKATGVGIWHVSLAGVGERHLPQLFRRRHNRLFDSLSEGHKTSAAAGTSKGGRWSPFRHTCQRLSELVAEHPGISMKESVEAINHHYASSASARCALAKWIDRGKIPGVTKIVEGGSTRLFPATAESDN